MAVSSERTPDIWQGEGELSAACCEVDQGTLLVAAVEVHLLLVEPAKTCTTALSLCPSPCPEYSVRTLYNFFFIFFIFLILCEPFDGHSLLLSYIDLLLILFSSDVAGLPHAKFYSRVLHLLP